MTNLTQQVFVASSFLSVVTMQEEKGSLCSSTVDILTERSLFFDRTLLFQNGMMCVRSSCKKSYVRRDM